MKTFWHVIRKNKYGYIIALSLATTILLVNTALEFSEKIISKRILILPSLIVFAYLLYVASRERLWENEREEER